jgi:serine protease
VKPILRTKRFKLGLLLATLALAAFQAAPASAADYVPGELIVSIGGGTDQVLKLPDQVGVQDAAAALSSNPRVSYAVPNYIATADVFPNDPGRRSGHPGDWKKYQWNFLNGPGGVNAPGAWHNVSAVGRPGAKGVRVAVIDTGVAYRKLGTRFRRSPDFNHTKFAAGKDFVDGDRMPLDLYGHGTHVAGTIAESTNNSLGVTGLAYRATIIPVRVLNRNGAGSAANVARGIRWAADHHARVINMSFDFHAGLGSKQLPGVFKALRYANGHGSLLVASAGNNHSTASLPYPAGAPQVISVAATTKSGCLANYSNWGGDKPGQVVDIAAPGGGVDAGACPASVLDGPEIRQFGFNTRYRGYKHFKLVGLEGTSQATPHVSAIAALVIARRVIGAHPSRGQMLNRLRDKGTPLPAPFGSVIRVNAANATTP